VVSQKQLPIPQAALVDPEAMELLRVWIADGGQHISLATGVWDDPASWGIMLVDLAKHIARAFEQSKGSNYEEALRRLRDGFDAEWSSPTDDPVGGLQE